MTRKNPANQESEVAKKLDLNRQTLRGLDVREGAAGIKGGLRTHKGSDPEDGGE